MLDGGISGVALGDPLVETAEDGHRIRSEFLSKELCTSDGESIVIGVQVHLLSDGEHVKVLLELVEGNVNSILNVDLVELSRGADVDKDRVLLLRLTINVTVVHVLNTDGLVVGS